MPQSDNTLGAPTEGLGQQITFAFSVPQAPQRQGGTLGQVNLRTAGGTANPGATGYMQTQRQPSQLLDRVAEEAGALGREEMKRKQTAAYLQGMQRAAMGEAVTDLAKEQPWFTKLFGESDVVQGARAYTSQAQANTILTSLEERMPELRSKSPEEMQLIYQDMVQGAMTGDEMTDAVTMTSLMKAMPSTMKRQAKEHYGYLQDQAVTAQAAAFRSGAQVLQAKAKGLQVGSVSQEEFAKYQQDFEASILPAPGQDPDRYRAQLTDLLMQQAAEGNFHVINSLTKTDGSPSALDVLDTKQRIAVDAAVARGEDRNRLKYSYEWGDRLATLEAYAAQPRPGWTAEHTATQVDALNEEYRKATGSNTGLILPNQRAAMLSGVAERIYAEQQRQLAEQQRRAEREADRLERAGERAAAARMKAEMMRTMTLTAAAQGQLGMLIDMPDVNKKEVDVQIDTAFRSLANPATPGLLSPQQAQMLGRSTNYTNALIADGLTQQLERELSKKELTPGVMAAAANYEALAAVNPQTATSYYGAQAGRLHGFIEDRKTLGDQQAFLNNFVYRQKPKVLSKDEAKALTSAATPSIIDRWFKGAMALKPGVTQGLAAKLGPDADQHRGASGMSDKDAYKAALHAQISGGKLELLGGYDLALAPGQASVASLLGAATTPKDYIPIPGEDVNRLVSDAIDGALFTDGNTTFKGDDMDYIRVHRLQDKGKMPQLAIDAYRDGQVFRTLLDGNDIWAKAKVAREMKNRKMPAGAQPLWATELPMDPNLPNH